MYSRYSENMTEIDITVFRQRYIVQTNYVFFLKWKNIKETSWSNLCSKRHLWISEMTRDLVFEFIRICRNRKIANWKDTQWPLGYYDLQAESKIIKEYLELKYKFRYNVMPRITNSQKSSRCTYSSVKTKSYNSYFQKKYSVWSSCKLLCDNIFDFDL